MEAVFNPDTRDDISAAESTTISDESMRDIPDADLGRLLSTMIHARIIDKRMTALHRQGRIGFYPASRGEEALHLAVYALSADDWVFPSARELGAWLWRGHPIADLVHQLYGNANDPLGGHQLPTHRADRNIRMVSVSAPVGTHIPQAVGAAHAAKLQQTGAVAMAFFGAGAAATGDFHTGLNFAGVYRAPVVFLCRHRQGPHGPQVAGDFAARARSYGIAYACADGSDVMAVIQTARTAIQRARNGEGATLLELTLAVEQAPGPVSAKDPIERFRAALVRRGLWSDAREQTVISDYERTLEDAIRAAEEAQPPAHKSLFDHVYEHLPAHLEQQRRDGETS